MGGMETPPIYLIESSNRRDLAETFMRFQEYYESPEFKGRVFSVEEFAHWYASKYGAWTYSRDWYGFNIPSKVLEPFRRGQFDPLTLKEKKLLDVCKNATGDFYVIGVTPSAEYFDETVKHEFVHGAFHVNENYRKDVARCLADHRIKTIKNGLSKMGYHSDVYNDEANAYVLVEPETISEIATKRDTQKLRVRLNSIFKKHFGFSVLETKVPNLMRRVEHVQV
mgnify:FL=1